MAELTQAHKDARAAAARLPALQASLDRLLTGEGVPVIAIVADTPEAPGAVLATINIDGDVPPAAVTEENYRIVIATPIEAQITTTGTAGHAQIYDAGGALWGTCTVSDSEGSGEIKLASLSLVQGAIARLTSAHIQG